MARKVESPGVPKQEPPGASKYDRAVWAAVRHAIHEAREPRGITELAAAIVAEGFQKNVRTVQLYLGGDRRVPKTMVKHLPAVLRGYRLPQSPGEAEEEHGPFSWPDERQHDAEECQPLPREPDLPPYNSSSVHRQADGGQSRLALEITGHCTAERVTELLNAVRQAGYVCDKLTLNAAGHAGT